MVNTGPDLNFSKDKYFILMDDIDKPVSFMIGQSGMTGTTARDFMGKFNGNNKRIHLAISHNVGPNSVAALFARVSTRYFG